MISGLTRIKDLLKTCLSLSLNECCDSTVLFDSILSLYKNIAGLTKELICRGIFSAVRSICFRYIINNTQLVIIEYIYIISCFVKFERSLFQGDCFLALFTLIATVKQWTVPSVAQAISCMNVEKLWHSYIYVLFYIILYVYKKYSHVESVVTVGFMDQKSCPPLQFVLGWPVKNQWPSKRKHESVSKINIWPVVSRGVLVLCTI